MFLTVTSWIMANEKFTLHSFRWMRGVQTRHCKTKKKNILLSKLKSSRVIIILVKYGRESFVWIVFCKSCWFFCVHLMWHSCTFNDEEESKNHQPRAGNFLSLPPNAKKRLFWQHCWWSLGQQRNNFDGFLKRVPPHTSSTTPFKSLFCIFKYVCVKSEVQTKDFAEQASCRGLWPDTLFQNFSSWYVD